MPDGHGGWLALTGNRIGVLLADICCRRLRGRRQPLCVQSIVSSPMLASICKAHGARLERTLTGFKWIWTAALALCQRGRGELRVRLRGGARLQRGLLVRDKDGISAGLALAVLAAEEKARGRSLRQRLEQLFYNTGCGSARSTTSRAKASPAAKPSRAPCRVGKHPPSASARAA